MKLLTKTLIKQLEEEYAERIEIDPSDKIELEQLFYAKHDLKGWEMFFSPEKNNYKDCLTKLDSNDIVFDIGAGDLRFDLMMAEKVTKVYAVEINPEVVSWSLEIISYNLPKNIVVICGNAFTLDLPKDVTVITCLMIHRQHEFPQEWRKQAKIISY